MSSKLSKPEELYGKDPNLKREDVEIVQEWLKKQPHLPHLEETQVIMFLHSCYYSIEQTKATIDFYFTKRTHVPHLFTHVGKEDLKAGLSVATLQMLPNKTPEGYVIFLGNLIDHRTENFHFPSLVRVAVMEYLLLIHQSSCPEGTVVIIDVSGVSFGHIIRITPTTLKHLADFVQEGAPLRLKAIHFVNVVPYLDKFLAMLKPLVKAELYDMIQLHSSLGSLHKYVPKECLPRECGGNLSEYRILQEENLKYVLQNYDFFEWHDTQIVDESKRIGKMPNSAFGEEGTFRKLDLD